MAKEKKEKNVKKENKSFMKNFKAELKRVVWPTPKQLLNSTIAVISIVLVIGVTVFVLDMGFELLNKQNAKLQSSLQEKYNVITNTTLHDHDHVNDASSVSNVTSNTTNTAE